MTAIAKQVGTLVLAVSCAFAQSTGSAVIVRNVAVTRQGADLRVEIILSGPVQPSIETAVNPDRILLDFPGTVSRGSAPDKVTVNTFGVLRVRIAQHSSVPPVTRVVLDLDQLHPYTMKAEGNRIFVTVSPTETASKNSHGGAPAPAMSGGLTGLFRHKETAPVVTAERSPAAPVAPPALPPLSVTSSAPKAAEPTVVASGTVAVLAAKSPATSDAPPPSFSSGQIAVSKQPSAGQVSDAGFPAAAPGQPTSSQGTVANTTFDAKADSTLAASKAAEEKATEAKAAETKAADQKTAETKAAKEKAAKAKVAEEKAAEAKAAEQKAAEAAAAEVMTPEERKAEAMAAEQKALEALNAGARAAEAEAAEKRAAEVAVKPAEAKPAEAKPAEPTTAAGTTEAEKAGVEKTGVEKTADEKPPEAAAVANADSAPADNVPVAASPVPAEAMLMTRTDDPSLRTVFKVKYVADGVAYLEGGRAQGLTEGMKLQIEETNLPTRQGASAHAANDPRVVAELEVSGVAETSAVTEIHEPKRPVKAGDLAYLSVNDTESLVQQRSMSSTRQYPAVISFSEGDPLDEEARAEVPRPPSPAVNRSRGRIGLDYNSTTTHGASSSTSSNLGFSFQGDVTRIGGTFWNLSGYYRGRFTKQPAGQQQTLQDLINHTYHLSLTYDNPTSKLVAGVGRLFLPWASSLDTIDGGYFGFHPKQGTTIGVFGGSTPDPTSWSYTPNRAISGSFVNFEGGDYEHFHYSSTSGGGVSMINWAVDRPFVFFEDTLSWGRRVGIYEAAQIDSPSGNGSAMSPGFGLGRSFLTMRVQPLDRLELNFNYNYFRDIPTPDPALLGTTLLDKFLFQGFSAGARVEVFKQVFVSGTLGRSDRSGDKSSSLNQQLGLTFNRLPWWKLRADARYSRFNSSFGTGSYESLSVSRQLSDTLRLEFLGGQQNFTSSVTSNNKSRFYTSTVETTLGPHYYVQGNFTVNRGELSYDQYLFSFGYRFDNRTKGRQ